MIIYFQLYGRFQFQFLCTLSSLHDEILHSMLLLVNYNYKASLQQLDFQGLSHDPPPWSARIQKNFFTLHVVI